MKRRQFLQAAGVGLAATAVAAPAIAQSMPEIKWRLTSSFPKSLDTIYGAAEVFSKAVAEATDNKFQIQVFAAGEIVPGLQAADAVSQRHRRDVPHRVLLLCRQGPDLRVRHRDSVRPQSAHDRRLDVLGGGMDLLNDVLQKYNIIGIPAGNTGAQMGGWFRKEIKESADLNGLKMRIGGFAGRVLAKLGAGAAAARRRRHLSGAGEGHARRVRVGRPLRRREARLPQGRAVLLLPGLVGRRPDAAQLHQHREVERAAEELPVDRAVGLARRRNTWMQAKYDAGNPGGAQAPGRRRRAAPPVPASR